MITLKINLHLVLYLVCCEGAEWFNKPEVSSYTPCTQEALQGNGGDITVRMPDCIALYAYCKHILL